MKARWITHPTILNGSSVDLIPLEKEHFHELYQAASSPKLWELIPTDCSISENFQAAYTTALLERDKGNHYPFIIFHKQTGKIIGSTRLFDIHPEDKKLEIGWSWIIEKYWGTGINLQCKLLLLTYCFEVLKARRVQLKTDQHNIRSRKAIVKIGAQFEGILRKDRIKEDGISRSAAYYSIIDDEWEGVKQNLTRMII